ncbi:MAG: hypothetical protein ACE5EC_03620 [Phycisphaerae bacterium]
MNRGALARYTGCCRKVIESTGSDRREDDAMPEGANHKTCEGCGGGITPEQIVQKQAGLVAGVLLCPRCVDQKRRELIAARSAAMQAQAAPVAQPAQAVSHDRQGDLTESGSSADLGTTSGGVWIPSVHDGVKDIADETLSLVSEAETPVTGTSKIRALERDGALSGEHKDTFKRPLMAHDEPATRVRTFHGKLTEAGLAHMDDLINEWIDSHPDLFIKSSSSTVGIFEGKTKEPHLLVTLFY